MPVPDRSVSTYTPYIGAAGDPYMSCGAMKGSKGMGAEWNAVDTMIAGIETALSRLIERIRDGEDRLPAPEEMIEAATRELQEENDELKRYRLPGILIQHGCSYACPNCGTEILDPSKYCPECGKRIMRPGTHRHRRDRDEDSPAIELPRQ